MRVAYVHGGDTVPSVMFRRPFFEQLAGKGHRVSYYGSVPNRYDSWPAIGWRVSQFLKRRIRSMQIDIIGARDYDTVVIETGLFHTDNVVLEEKLRRVSKRLVYEIDDAVFLLFPEKVGRIAEIADHVIAGNRAIADWISLWNKSVSVIPTCVRSKQYPSKWQDIGQRSIVDSQKLVIGWIGSASNVPFLKICLPVLERLAEEFPLEVRIVTAVKAHGSLTSSKPSLLQWVDIDRCDATDQIRKFDVGIMPLPPDDEWSRYKCNAKMVQYMMSGLATIASDTGYNRTLVTHGETGMLASAPEDWLAACRHLLPDSSKRQVIGVAARNSMLDTHAVESRSGEYELAVWGT